jgi:peptidyl-prolyl cis-trans isomerase A (cyclophilin A)
MPMIFKRRGLLAVLPALAAWPALAQAPVPPRPRVALTTAQGVIVIELATDKAPITTANFLRYVDFKRFDGTSFYRASTPPGQPNKGDDGLLQGGTQGDPARNLKPIAHEPTTLTGLSHTDGTVSMGRFAPGSATGDFFICVGDQTYLDADPKATPPTPGFAAFAHVVDGMALVKTLLMAHVSPTAGEGPMKGEMLDPPVRILTARRVG